MDACRAPLRAVGLIAAIAAAGVAWMGEAAAATLQEDSLSFSALPGETVSAPLTVTADSASAWSVRITTTNFGSVAPGTIYGSSGTVTYSYPVSGTAEVGDTFTGTITLEECANPDCTINSITTIPVTVHAGFAAAEEPGLTDRQQRVGIVLDQSCEAIADISPSERTAGQAGLLEACATVQDAGSPGAVLDELAPEEVALQWRMAQVIMQSQLFNVDGRLGRVRNGVPAVDLAGLNLAYNGQYLPADLLQYAANGVVSDGGGSGQSFSRLGVYVNGSVARGSRDGTAREQGFETDTLSLTMGGDYRLSSRLVLGAALGYARNDSELDGDAGELEVDGYTASLYGTYFRPAGYYVDAIVTYGRNSYDVTRGLGLGGGGATARSDPDGSQYLISVDGGYDITRGALTVGLQARVVYLTGSIDGYDETPSGPSASGVLLHIEEQDLESLTTELAAQLSYAISTRVGVISPTARLGWEHQFQQDSRFIAAQFLNDPTGTTFKVRTDEPDRNYFNVGAGVTAQFTRGRSAFLFVETTLGREETRYYALDAGVRLAF